MCSPLHRLLERIGYPLYTWIALLVRPNSDHIESAGSGGIFFLGLQKMFCGMMQPTLFVLVNALNSSPIMGAISIPDLHEHHCFAIFHDQVYFPVAGVIITFQQA